MSELEQFKSGIGECVQHHAPLAYVVINEQHTLLPEQRELLDERFGCDGWKPLLVPAAGWSLAELEAIARAWPLETAAVFASSIPVLIRDLARRAVCYVFHNDRREKVELPNGKIISRVAKTGWELV
jgi:hypothetical protein